MKRNSIKYIRCAPYHPSSNGLVKRFNQTLKQSLRASEKHGRSLAHRLCDCLLTYRATPHVTTNRTPASLMLNRELRTRFSLLQPDVSADVHAKQEKQMVQHDQHAKARHFQEGQNVMVRDFHPSKPKWVPGKVIKQTGPLSYVVNVGIGLDWKRHVDHLRESSSETDVELNQHDGSDDQYVDYTICRHPRIGCNCNARNFISVHRELATLSNTSKQTTGQVHANNGLLILWGRNVVYLDTCYL